MRRKILQSEMDGKEILRRNEESKTGKEEIKEYEGGTKMRGRNSHERRKMVKGKRTAKEKRGTTKRKKEG